MKSNAFPPIIGIAGPGRSGKDTVADFLVAETNGYVYALADPLRAMIRAGLGVDLNQPYWIERKEEVIAAIGKTPRQIIQTLGTEWGRNMISEDLWLVMANVRLMQRGAGMIVPDVRFENEAAWIRDRGGVVIHLRRKNAPNVNPHTSEAGVLPVVGEVTVHNDGSIQDLQNEIGSIIDGWKT